MKGIKSEGEAMSRKLKSFRKIQNYIFSIAIYLINLSNFFYLFKI